MDIYNSVYTRLPVPLSNSLSLLKTGRAIHTCPSSTSRTNGDAFFILYIYIYMWYAHEYILKPTDGISSFIPKSTHCAWVLALQASLRFFFIFILTHIYTHNIYVYIICGLQHRESKVVERSLNPSLSSACKKTNFFPNFFDIFKAARSSSDHSSFLMDCFELRVFSSNLNVFHDTHPVIINSEWLNFYHRVSRNLSFFFSNFRKKKSSYEIGEKLTYENRSLQFGSIGK